MPVNAAVVANQAKIAMARPTATVRTYLVGRKLIMNKNSPGPAMVALDQTFKGLIGRAAGSSPLICCLFDHDRSLIYAEPMPRDPSPAIGQRIDQNFAGIVERATLLNPAVHDGAIMASVDAHMQHYWMVIPIVSSTSSVRRTP
jgi:hypothetical protein